MEIRDEFDIPFASDAYCYTCLQTDEEIELTRLAQEFRKQKTDLATLALLIQTYPEEAKKLIGQ